MWQRVLPAEYPVLRRYDAGCKYPIFARHWPRSPNTVGGIAQGETRPGTQEEGLP